MEANMKKTLMQGLFACGLLLGASAVQAQLAVVMGPNGAPISKDILANLYLGRSFEFKAIDLPEGSPMRDHFYKKLTDRDPAQVKAVWARVVFTGKGQAPLMLPDAESIKKAVATDPKAIGYIDTSAVDSTVKVVFTID
jgi:ABC-type phosphate transport system substrate-binding protein